MAEVHVKRLHKASRTAPSRSRSSTSSIGDGELFVMLGPSGCGKTTTLRCIAGLEQETVGRHPHRRRGRQRPAPVERDIAMVFQFYALYPHLTRARQHGVPAARGQGARSRRSASASTRRRGCCSSSRSSTRKPSKLSGGEQQRVALGARAGAPPAGVPDGRAADQPGRRAARRHARRDQAPPGSGWARRWSTSPTTRSRRCRSGTGSRSSTRAGSSRSAPRWRSTTARRRCSRARFIGSPPMNLIEAEVDQRAPDARPAGSKIAAPDGLERGRPRDRRRAARSARASTRRGDERSVRGRVVSARGAGRRDDLRRRDRGRAAARPDAPDRPLRRRSSRGRAPPGAAPPVYDPETEEVVSRCGRDRRAAASRSPSATSRRSTGLELDVPDGAFFVLLGPSGAGKTTTLRVIAGLEKPDAGIVHLDGIDATKATPGRARPGDGVPELRALPEADGGAEHRLAAAGAQAVQGRDRRAGQAGRRAAAHRAAAGAQARRRCRAARCSASRSGARSCATRARS